VGGNTDIGFQFGLLGVLARFKDGFDPYRWRFQLILDTSIKKIDGSTKFPTHEYILEGDFPGLVNNKLRMMTITGFTRQSNLGYFGLGNDSSAAPLRDNSKERSRSNEYIRNQTQAKVTALIVAGNHLELALGLDARYVAPELYDGSKLETDFETGEQTGTQAIHGVQNHFTVGLAAGLLYDTRDHETAPTTGMYHELAFRVVPGIATDFWYTGATLHTRFFFPLARDYLVLGVRLAGDLLGGNPPVYELGQMGTIKQFATWGAFGVRGVPKDRFLGKIRIIGAIELRSMFLKFKIKTQRFRVGLVGFFDSGRVWADYTPNKALDGNNVGLKFGTGGGLRVQWGETVMIRADVAYSPQMAGLGSNSPVGFYVDLGHTF
jgi:outer membrane protein assembly factor BamA